MKRVFRVPSVRVFSVVRFAAIALAATTGWLLAGQLSQPTQADEQPAATRTRPARAAGETQLLAFNQATAAKSPKGTGAVSGVVTLSGAAPTLAPLVKKGDPNAKDAAVCAAETVPNESVVVGADNGLANVFIYLVRAPAGHKADAVPKDPIVFDQKGCRFLPHSLLVRVGQTVLVKSGDPIAHNTHTVTVRGTPFNQAIKADDRVGTPLIYDKPEKLPCEVKCDLHSWMKAYHLVLDHPFMAVTDADGKFQIAGLPPGKHKFVVWHEKVGYVNRDYEVEIKADGTTDVKLAVPAAKMAAFNGPAPRSIVVSAAD